MEITVRAVHDEQDYEVVLAEIGELMDAQPGSPDGMKIDQQGHLYVAGATGVWVFEPDGTHLGVIVTPERPSNCAWGDGDGQTLYITARTSLYRIRTKVPGLVATGGKR